MMGAPFKLRSNNAFILLATFSNGDHSYLRSLASAVLHVGPRSTPRMPAHESVRRKACSQIKNHGEVVLARLLRGVHHRLKGETGSGVVRLVAPASLLGPHRITEVVIRRRPGSLAALPHLVPHLMHSPLVLYAGEEAVGEDLTTPVSGRGGGGKRDDTCVAPHERCCPGEAVAQVPVQLVKRIHAKLHAVGTTLIKFKRRAGLGRVGWGGEMSG